jgi:hypothetical protein
MENNEYKGFSLFKDQDEPLRSRNRGVILANIAEDNTTKDKKVTPKGAALMMGYFNEIPKEERNDVLGSFVANMNQRGFAIVTE